MKIYESSRREKNCKINRLVNYLEKFENEQKWLFLNSIVKIEVFIDYCSKCVSIEWFDKKNGYYKSIILYSLAEFNKYFTLIEQGLKINNTFIEKNFKKIKYIPSLNSHKKSFNVFANYKPYYIPKDKVRIDNIKIDSSLFSFKNNILESKIIEITENFFLGLWEPILVNKNLYLLDGQHRLEAAKRMNLRFIDVIVEDSELIEKHRTKTKIKYREKKFIL